MFSLKKVFRSGYFWLSILSITVVAIASALVPLETANILNYALAKDINTLVMWSIVLLATIAILLIFESFSQYFSVKYSNKFKADMVNHLTISIRKKDSYSFQKKGAVDYLSYYNNDIEVLEEDYFQSILKSYQGFIALIANVSVLFTLDKLLMVVVVISSLIPMLIPFIFQKHLAKLKSENMSQISNFNNKLSDFLDGFQLMKGFKKEDKFLNRLNLATENMNESKESHEKADVTSNLITGVAFYISFIASLIIGAYRIATGTTTVGAVTGILQISDNLIYPINLISSQTKTLMATKTIRNDFEKLCIFDEKTNNYEDLDDTQNAIVLKDLSFGYNDTKILNKVNFTFEKDKKYLLVGPSGQGKSTLLHLISGDISDFSGKVLVNKDIKNGIRLIPQKSLLIRDSIINNLTLFSDKPLKNVKDTLEKFKLNKFSNSEKLEAEFPNNVSPSGGEVQRMSISRTLLDQPLLLLLDEVTSALDKENQKFVEEELLRNFKGTVISVSHNYSEESLNYYDYIVEINDSNISVINKTDLQKNKPHNN